MIKMKMYNELHNGMLIQTEIVSDHPMNQFIVVLLLDDIYQHDETIVLLQQILIKLI